MNKITTLIQTLWNPVVNQYVKLKRRFKRSKQELLPIEDYEHYLA